MNDHTGEIIEIKLADLIPFGLQSSQTYHGERLEQLMSSIERLGLMTPIIVRPTTDGKYEIICGHNRTKAMEALGRDVIQADVRVGLTDDEAIELFYDSNLNQQSFSDWSYAQKIEAIKYTEKMIQENSRQGKRTDLDEKMTDESEGGTSVQSRQKLGHNPKRSTTRDKMARRLGIATATLSKYRSIIKLPDKIIESMARLLDQKKISFEAAYVISGLKPYEIEILLSYVEYYQRKKIDMIKLKSLRNKSKRIQLGLLAKAEIEEILLSKEYK